MDRSLAEEVGAGIGRDARARGVNYMLGPGVNIYRSPRNGRNFEYFGEDPYLAGQMAVGYITGMQQQGVSATVKHYLGNNSEFLRHDSDTVIDERTLREIYLPAFEAAVKQGHVGAVMDSYNLVDGVHATQNSYINTEIMRREWGFQGTLMSDWDATYDGVGAANGGLDIEMPTGKFMNAATLEPALKSGAVKPETIDEKVTHILDTAMMFGWLDREQREIATSVDDHASHATALKSARESVTLLKNVGGVLPLDRSTVKTVLVVGPVAYPGAAVGGGSAGVVPFHAVSLLEGMESAGGGVKVLYEAGLPTLSDLAMRTNFTTTAEGKTPGLTLEVFASKDLTGESHTGQATHVNNTGRGWDAISGNLDELMALFMAPPQSISQRFTGYVQVPAAEPYLLAVGGAGEGNGERVFVDGKLLIDDWAEVRAFEPHMLLPLAAGAHKVVVESWQKGVIGGKLRVALVPAASVVTQRAKQMAKLADVVVVAAGYTSTRDANTESEGGDRTFDLPYGQDELIEAMAAANPKTIVTVTSGGNVDSELWIAKVPALVEAWYGGQEGGRALAEVLFGEVNPSGHLPATFERRAEDNPTFNTYYPAPGTIQVTYSEGLFVGYRGYEKNHVQPLFPFGYGLSYTTFGFSGLKVTPGGAGLATVAFDVRNTGRRAGATVAQVYVADGHAPVARPARELKGFERVSLAAGESRHVVITLDARAFAYYDVGGKTWKIDPGMFGVEVGDSVESLPLKGSVAIGKDVVAGVRF